MKTENLTKTNLPGILTVRELETFLSKELENVIEYVDGIRPPGLIISPYTKICASSMEFRNLDYRVRSIEFDRSTGVLKVLHRRRWQRAFTCSVYQLAKVGYKLPTTHVPEGYIWGNPVITVELKF